MHQSAAPLSRIRFGPFELDVRSGELRQGSTRLKVPDQSIEILKALLETPNDLVTRDRLRERLWPSDTFVDFEHGLNAAVRRLREALGDSADTPKFIETLPRRGYRFIGPVEDASTLATVESSAQRASESPPASEGVTPSAPPRADETRRSLVRITQIKLRRLALAASIVLAVGAGLWIVRTTRERLSTALPATPSIPVTSFPGVEADPALSPDGNQVASRLAACR
jgi:DNA-binding winged helix-turn-helix (wHTH) protein